MSFGGPYTLAVVDSVAASDCADAELASGERLASLLAELLFWGALRHLKSPIELEANRRPSKRPLSALGCAISSSRPYSVCG